MDEGSLSFDQKICIECMSKKGLVLELLIVHGEKSCNILVNNLSLETPQRLLKS